MSGRTGILTLMAPTAALTHPISEAAIDVDGPWTPEVVQTMIGLLSVHDVATDRGREYPWWRWTYVAPLYEFDVLGFLDIDTDGWAFVLELSGPQERASHPRRTWISPAIEFHGEMEQVYVEAARLLNDGASRVNRRGDR